MRQINRYIIQMTLAMNAFSFNSMANCENSFEVVPILSHDVFIPDGFDDNDEIVIVLDGTLPDSCYKIIAPQYNVDLLANEIRITQNANKYSGTCLTTQTPFTSEIRIDLLPQGMYEVVANDGATRIPLEIHEAMSAGPDDYLFPQIKDVTVHHSGANEHATYFATLTGNFTSSCMVWEHERSKLNEKTIVLQPIVKILDHPVCEDVIMPFQFKVSLPAPVESGRYLLHTRSLNGKSINRVFSAVIH